MARAPLPEKPFPRGGIKPKKWGQGDADFSLFKSKKNKKIKKKHNNSHSNRTKKVVSVAKTLDAAVIHDLIPGDLRLGSVVLGCVDKITDTNVQLSLPGNLRVIVSGGNINPKYTSLIHSSRLELPALTDLFEIDQQLPVAILENCEESKSKYKASLDPKDVNSNLSPRFLQKGMILSGYVSSHEEHGYVIDLGIPKVTAFLSKDKTVSGVSYHVAKPVSVCITKLSSDQRTLQVSAVIKEHADISPDLPINCFVPGFRWKLMVTKSIKNGVEVALKEFGPNIKGYVHMHHLEKIFDKISNYPEGTELNGTLLYVLPSLNYPFFMVSQQEAPVWNLPFGSLAKNVKVTRTANSGLTGMIEQKTGHVKCFIPVNRIDICNKNAEEETPLKELYPIGTVLPLVRIERPSRLSRLYFGAIDKEALKNQIYSKHDLQVGQRLKCTMAVVGAKYCTVEISRNVKGYVSALHVTERPGGDYTTKVKPGQVLKARVLDIGENEELVRLTLKPSLVKSNPILSQKTIVRPGEMYLGSVLHVDADKIVVEFFGSRIGYIMRSNLGVPSNIPLKSAYVPGQVVKCYVIMEANNTLSMSATLDSEVSELMRVGEKYVCTVTDVSKKGLYLNMQTRRKGVSQGFLPRELISSCQTISRLTIESYSINDKITAICVHISEQRNPSSLMAVHPAIFNYYKENTNSGEKIVSGQILPFIHLPGINKEESEIKPAVPYFSKFKFLNTSKEHKYARDYQLFIAKIKSIVSLDVTISTSLVDVWDRHYMSSLNDLVDNLERIENLQLQLKKKKSPLADLKIGQVVDGSVKPSTKKFTVFKLKGNKEVQAKCWRKFNKEKEINGRVVWIDYIQHVVWIQPYPKKEIIVEKPETQSTVRCRVVHTCPEVVVADTIGSHDLVFIPTKRHINDTRTYEAAYTVGDVTRFSVHQIRSKLVGVDQQIANKTRKKLKRTEKVHERRNFAVEPESIETENTEKMTVSKKRKVAKKSENIATESSAVPVCKKRKVDERKSHQTDGFGAASEEPTIEYVKEGTGMEFDPIKQEVLSDEDEDSPISAWEKPGDSSDTEIKSECDSKEDPAEDAADVDSDSSDSSDEDKPITKPMPGLDVGFDWSVAENPQLLRGALSRAAADDSSFDDEEEVDLTEKKKRKKLTGAEKKEKAKEMEERLRRREFELVDPNRPPQSADDFDRLVMGSPDDSSVWLQYMAHHLENTEIEKARAVARRALKLISFREEQEKLNVWFALLNLEQLYGTSDSQKAVLEEALRCNEPYKIHLHKLNMLVDGGVGLEAEQLANAMIKKYGESEAVWWEVSGALMKMGKLDFARTILQRGMSTLPNSKHVALITKFAQLENKYGNSERAQTLYEHILSAFPKRVDVWSAYVDLMVKSGRIDLARQILERATSQSLPLKKMKTIFKKFAAFEDLHGTPENAEKVRQAAVEFIETVGEESK